MPKGYSARDKIVDDLAREAELPLIAEELGVRVVGRGGSQPKALCPFHDDRTPSLSFYSAKASSRAQFHCFACNAHGDVFDLIKKQLSCDFPAALKWLAQRKGINLPTRGSNRGGPATDPRVSGLLLAEQAYQNESPNESGVRATFAESRGFASAFLHQASVFGATPGKLAALAKTLGREAQDSLEAAGLLVRPRAQRDLRGALTLPLDVAVDFFRTPRVLFTLRDERGRVTGFAGRAVAHNDTPKYLYSSGFPRSKTLYRLDKVRLRLLNRNAPVGSIAELFVVEGLLDALRLETLGLDSIAIFGAHMTAEQIDLVAELARELDRNSVQLAVHLFLDADDAGRRGTLTTLAALLVKSAETTGFLIDVIVPPELGRKRDPDELLRSVARTANARQMLYEWIYSPMHVLLGAAAGCAPSELEQLIERMPPSSRLRCYREVERRLDRAQWSYIFDRIAPWSVWRGDESPVPLERSWDAPLRAFLTSATHLLPQQPLRENIVAPEKAEENKLSRALHIAQSSTQRRELPVDEGSWDRLKAAIDVTVPYLKELLSDAAPLDEPMIAICIPKPNGDFRLKALACPEFLTLQQYVLNELIRDYPESPRFRECIPAVRYTASADGVMLETTGIRDSAAANETVSFAYQIDMDVVTGRIPPRREGMFRPYYPCWENFIAFIDRRVRACGFDRFYVARLDIRKFYDSVPRSAVLDTILPGVRNALRELEDRYEAGALRCARLFSPETTNADQRAQRLVDWLCDQSFNYEYEDPRTGFPNRQSHGMPQGPDLSAYLANIALFPLDCVLREMVAQLDSHAQKESGGDKLKRGAVYARYVDDMVIVASTAQDLARLRAIIEEHLGRIGLELSPKTEPLPSMSESELREWLTSRRGAGLGVSGPFEGPPVNEPLSALDPLGDAGDIDRGKSLTILHHPQFEGPDTSNHDLREAVAVARRADELRHADLVKAAAMLWRAALRLDDGSLLPMQEGVERLVQFWSETSPVLEASPPQEDGGPQTYVPTISDVLCWLDGLHKLIFSRPDRSPDFSSQQRTVLDKFRRHVASLVQSGLCDEVNKLLPKEALEKYKHMFELRCLAVF
ncbi:MAG: hypothetical protein JWR69_202, partial [Pedosphaera sp.]|nr:hypothetical protein [Pedosphaera sp.]